MLRPTNTTPVTTRSTALAGDCGALIVMLMSERDHAGTVISLVTMIVWPLWTLSDTLALSFTGV